MRARFQSDMSADSEKICDRFTDFLASGPMLQPKRTYPFAKWRTLKVKLLGKKGRLMKRRSTFLYHSGGNIPAFLTKKLKSLICSYSKFQSSCLSNSYISTIISTAYDVQKKLENLRTYFGKEYGKELQSKPRSGSGAVKAFHSSWPYYKSLMLLKDQIRSDRPNVCNLTVEDDLDSACSVSQDPETPNKPVKKTTKKLTTEECLIKAAEQIVEKNPPGPTISPKRSKLSDDEHFGPTVARQLARLEEEEEKETLKLQIQVLIHNSQYGTRPSQQFMLKSNVPFQY